MVAGLVKIILKKDGKILCTVQSVFVSLTHQTSKKIKVMTHTFNSLSIEMSRVCRMILVQLQKDLKDQDHAALESLYGQEQNIRMQLAKMQYDTTAQ